MKRTRVSGTVCTKGGQKTRTPETLIKTMETQRFSLGKKHDRTQLTENLAKPLETQRFGQWAEKHGAPPRLSRPSIPLGNHCKTNGKLINPRIINGNPTYPPRQKNTTDYNYAKTPITPLGRQRFRGWAENTNDYSNRKALQNYWKTNVFEGGQKHEILTFVVNDLSKLIAGHVIFK